MNGRLFLLLIGCLILLGCHPSPTRVKLVEGSNSPTFELSGNGPLGALVIFGPYDRLANLNKANEHIENVTPLWEIDPEQSVRYGVAAASPFVYGKMPSRFIQVHPKTGDAPPLQEGKLYDLLVYTSAGTNPFVGTAFQIKEGKAFQTAR